MGYYGADDQGNPPSFDFGTGMNTGGQGASSPFEVGGDSGGGGFQWPAWMGPAPQNQLYGGGAQPRGYNPDGSPFRLGIDDLSKMNPVSNYATSPYQFAPAGGGYGGDPRPRPVDPLPPNLPPGFRMGGGGGGGYDPRGMSYITDPRLGGGYQGNAAASSLQGNPLSSLFAAIRQGGMRQQNWGGGGQRWGQPQGGPYRGREGEGDIGNGTVAQPRRQPGQGNENNAGIGRQTGGWTRGPQQTQYAGAPQGQTYVPYDPLGQQASGGGPAANPNAPYSPTGSLPQSQPQGGAIGAAKPAGPVYNPSQRLRI